MKSEEGTEGSDSDRGLSKYRYVILALCTSATFLEYATRANITNAIVSMVSRSHPEDSNSTTKTFVSDFCPIPDHIKNALAPSENSTSLSLDEETFDWDPAIQGIILGAFFYGFILLQIPAGRLAELIGGKWIVLVGMIGSGVVNLLTPILARSVGWMISSRVFLGLIQGGIHPSCFSLIVRWSSKEEKALGFGIVNVGSNLGVVAAASVTGVLSENLGWKWTFYGTGGIALAWTLLWLGLAQNEPNVTSFKGEDKEREKNMAEGKKRVSRTPWFRILRNKAVLAVLSARFAGAYSFWTLQTKLPGYLQDILHVEPSINGVLNSLLYIAAGVSTVAATYVSEIVISRGWLSRTNARKAFTGIGLYGTCVCLCIVPFTNCNKAAAMTFLIIGITFYAMVTGGDIICPAEISAKFSTTIFAMACTCGSLAGMMAPLVIGLILSTATSGNDLKHKWDIVFFLVAAVTAIMTTIFVIFGSADIQTDIDDDPDLDKVTVTVVENGHGQEGQTMAEENLESEWIEGHKGSPVDENQNVLNASNETNRSNDDSRVDGLNDSGVEIEKKGSENETNCLSDSGVEIERKGSNDETNCLNDSGVEIERKGSDNGTNCPNDDSGVEIEKRRSNDDWPLRT